jgi:hypothetical protein
LHTHYYPSRSFPSEQSSEDPHEYPLAQSETDFEIMGWDLPQRTSPPILMSSPSLFWSVGTRKLFLSHHREPSWCQNLFCFGCGLNPLVWSSWTIICHREIEMLHHLRLPSKACSVKTSGILRNLLGYFFSSS